MSGAGTAPKVLLVTQGDPKSNGVCEILLRELASHYPPGRLVRYTLIDTPISRVESSWLGFRAVMHPVEYSSRPLLSTWKHRQFNRHSGPAIAEEIRGLIRDEQIDLIWVILNSANAISLADQLTSENQLPLVTTVWDDPEFVAATHYMDPWTTRGVLRRFKSVLQRSRRVAVASEGMAEAYASKYQIRGIPLIHGLHPSLWRTPAQPTAHKVAHVVGFAGSLHCKTEWNALVAAIDDWNRSEAVPIRVRFIGQFPRFGARKAQFVEHVGSVSLPEAIDAIAATDVAYVPYWFDRRRAWAAKTAFPSKLSAYVAAGVPVLYHGPVDSSPAIFLRRYPVGMSCHSLQSEEIRRTLHTLLCDQRVRHSATIERRRALDEQLGAEAMLRRFADVIGVDRALLLPVAAAIGDRP
jgi:hypothetical protein